MAGHQGSDDTGRSVPAAERRWRQPSVHRLTPSERRVLDEALRGGTTRDIAQALFVTEATIRTHLTRIYEKVGVRNRIELLANCLVEPPLASPPSARVPEHRIELLANCLLEPALAPVVSPTAPSVRALEPRAVLPDFVWTCLYIAGLLAASGLLAHLTLLSAFLGPTLIAAHVVLVRSSVANRRVHSAVLTAGVLLSAEQISVLVALRML